MFGVLEWHLGGRPDELTHDDLIIREKGIEKKKNHIDKEHSETGSGREHEPPSPATDVGFAHKITSARRKQRGAPLLSMVDGWELSFILEPVMKTTF
jgi:hypothetical protein